MKPYSLTRRLIAAVLLVELASALALIALAGVYESVSHFRAFDVMLEGRVDSVLGAIEDSEDAADNLALDRNDLHLPRRDIYLVRDSGGLLLGHSDNWPDAASFDVALPRRAPSAFAGLENAAGEGKPDNRVFESFSVHGEHFRALRGTGFRTVDAEDGHGLKRQVIVIYGARTEPVWESVTQALTFYSLVSLLLLVASGLVMLGLLRRGLRPLNQLAEQAKGVSVQSWTFAPGQEARSVRELAPLILALETLLAGLERAFEQQTQFVSDAAHELKTSVAVVKSSIQVLGMRPRTAGEYSAGLERLELDCGRMEDLVASMLTLAGLEARRETEQPGETGLAGLLAEVVEHLRTVAEVGGVALLLEAPEEIVVRGERDALRLLATNLILNAIQHSPPGEQVRIVLARQNGSAQIAIEDHGSGIAPELLPRIFDRFFRGDPSRSRRTGGTGLGLAIARAVALRSDGSIELASRVDQGTLVQVSLPEVSLPARPAQRPNVGSETSSSPRSSATFSKD